MCVSCLHPADTSLNNSTKQQSLQIRSLQCLFALVLLLFNVQVQKIYVETRKRRPLLIKSRDLRV